MSKAKAVDLVVDHPDRVPVPAGTTAFEMFTSAIFGAIHSRDKVKETKFLKISDHARLCQTLLENSWIIALVECVLQRLPDEVLNAFIAHESIPFEYRLVWWIILNQLDLYKTRTPARIVSEMSQRALAFNLELENSAAQLLLYQFSIDSALVRLKEYMADDAIAPEASVSAELLAPAAETGKAADAPAASRTASADTAPETTLAENPKTEETGEGGDVDMKDPEEREASNPPTPRTPPTPRGTTPNDEELDTGIDDTKDMEFGKNGEGKQPEMETVKYPKKKRKHENGEGKQPEMETVKDPKKKRKTDAAGAADTEKPELDDLMSTFSTQIMLLVNCYATKEALDQWDELLVHIEMAFKDRGQTPLKTIQLAAALHERVFNFVALLKLVFVGAKLSDEMDEYFLQAAHATFDHNSDYIDGVMPAKELAVIYKILMVVCGHDGKDWRGLEK